MASFVGIPFPIGVAKKGRFRSWMSFRTGTSALEYAEPLPTITNGLLASIKSLTAFATSKTNFWLVKIWKRYSLTLIQFMKLNWFCLMLNKQRQRYFVKCRKLKNSILDFIVTSFSRKGDWRWQRNCWSILDVCSWDSPTKNITWQINICRTCGYQFSLSKSYSVLKLILNKF